MTPLTFEIAPGDPRERLDKLVVVDVTLTRGVDSPTEVGLAEDDDFAYVMGLVRQAFEYQMGGD